MDIAVASVSVRWLTRLGSSLRLLLVLAIGLVVAVPGVAGGTAQAAYEVRDASATNRTIESDESGESVFSISFTASSAGEMRRIRSRVEVSHSSDTDADEVLLIGITVGCFAGSLADQPLKPNWPKQDRIAHTTNSVRGAAAARLYPRFIFVAPAPGVYTCTLSALSSRPREGNPPHPLSDQWVFIDSSTTSASGNASYLEATAPLSAGSGYGRDVDASWTLLGGGSAVDVAAWSPEFVAPAGDNTFSMSGDIALTACTAEGGSDDPGDDPDRGHLCVGHKQAGPSRVRVTLSAFQRSVNGGYCVTNTVDTRLFNISADTHHHVEYTSGLVNVSSDVACSRTFRLKLYVRHVNGPAVVVQTSSAITTAIP